MKMKHALLRALVGFACAGGLGCSSTHQEALTFLNARNHISQGSGYLLAPTDVISVFSPQAPEVSGTYTIRADGTIRLKLVGNIRIAGLTAREVGAKLTREMQTYYKEPVIHVGVEKYASKVFYVYGEITARDGAAGGGDRGAAVLPITGRDTILNVLARNPPTQNAWLTQIKLIRPGPTQKENQEIRIDFQKMITRGDLTNDVLMQQGDILVIPPTPMAWLGYRIRELLQPVNPVINAYQAPARIIDADDAYDDEEDSNGSSINLLSGLSLPGT